MKELTKSLNRFSLAMSLLGAKQLLGALERPAPGSRGQAPTAPTATPDLDAVTQAGAQRLDGAWQRAFEAGDNLQRSAVDLAFGVLTLQALNPQRFTALSADLIRQSTAALRSLLPGGGAAPSPAAAQPAAAGQRAAAR
jgi:hypothetical protein